MLEKKAPIPYPAIITPVTNPFLSGKWDQPECKAHGYKKPAPMPKTNPKNKIKISGVGAKPAIIVEPLHIKLPIMIVLCVN